MNNKHLVFCGYNVFPYGFAQTQRILLIAKGLKELNCNITVFCTYGTYNKTQPNVIYKGQYEGIDYLYCSGLTIRPTSFINRNIKKFKGYFVEFYKLLQYKLVGKLDYIFISTNYFNNVLYYSIISKILFVPTVIDNTEFWSASKKDNFGIEAKLYDYLSPILFKKVICISDYLYQQTIKTKSISNVIKIPVVVDFSKFTNSQDDMRIKEKMILFCGSASYYPIIDFIITSFELVKVDSVKLVIVSSNGSELDYNKLKNRIQQSSKSSSIEFKSNLKFNDLISLYIMSYALLIPMRNNIQDIARFPHKLGEYTASRSIIITTNNGEIPNYFEDMKNALVANEYNSSIFAEKIEYAVNNYSSLSKLRESSYETGLKNFDYKVNGQRIYNFLFPNTL